MKREKERGRLPAVRIANGMREMPCVAARIRDRNVSGRDSSSRRFPLAGKEDAREDQAPLQRCMRANV